MTVVLLHSTLDFVTILDIHAESDVVLLRATAQGNRQALAQLYGRHGPWLVLRLIPAESHLSWTRWCGAPTSATVRVGWSGGTAEVTGSMPDSPGCPPGAGRPVLSARQLRPAAEIRSGLQAL